MRIITRNKKPRIAAGFFAMTLRLRLAGNYADVLAALGAFLFENDLASALGEQRVIAPEAYVGSRVKTRTALSHENISGNHFLPAEYFHAKAFTL
jgi:hypothetical protein